MNSAVLPAAADKKQGAVKNKFDFCKLYIHQTIPLNLEICPQVESEIKPTFVLKKGQDTPFVLSTIVWSGGFFAFFLLGMGTGVVAPVQISIFRPYLFFLVLFPVLGAILLLKTPLLIKRRNRSSICHLTRAIPEQGTLYSVW